MRKIFFLLTLLAAVNFSCESFVDSVANTASALSEGLVAYYPFNGNSNDASGNGNHITAVVYIPPASNPNPSLNSTIPDRHGNFNTCYRFDDQYMTIPITKLTNTFTISLWVNIQSHVNKIDVPDIKLDDVIISKGTLLGTIGDADFFITVKPSASNIILKYGHGVESDAAYSNGGVTPLNTWDHLVIVYDNTMSYAYKNGVISGMSFIEPGQRQESGGSFALGKLAGSNTLYMDGLIDEVRIYNRALSTAEVKALYNHEKP